MDEPLSFRTPGDSGLTITVTRTSVQETRLAVAGELDRTTGGQLIDAVDRALATGRPRTIRVDLAGLTIIDAGGLRTLGYARARCAAAACELWLRDAPPAVLRLLSLAGQWVETASTDHDPGLARKLADDRRLMAIHLDNAAALQTSAREAASRAHEMRRHNAALRARIAARRPHEPGHGSSAE
ncbi:STAS domain-containing protein [Cryptosporangium japonicum]|uniref:STAS domain-containing protein n=1 Tax=Cryptosporangium japonicum TaxID=80872 RepID=A0ABN0TRE4_9ACTN